MTGFIYWHFFTITINYTSSQSMTKTCSIPNQATDVFFSTVTGLVLIYESVTSSASVVRWLTLHSWTLSYSYEWIDEFTNELSFITRDEQKRDHHLKLFVCYCLFHPLLRNVCQSRDNALISTSVFVAMKRACSEPLSRNGLFRYNMNTRYYYFLIYGDVCENDVIESRWGY
jgi:hypothetical protein